MQPGEHGTGQACDIYTLVCTHNFSCKVHLNARARVMERVMPTSRLLPAARAAVELRCYAHSNSSGSGCGGGPLLTARHNQDVG